jgi:hypothetical protein
MSKISTDKKIQIANIERAKAKIDDDVWRTQILPRFGAVADADGRVSLKSVPANRLDDLIAELRSKSGINSDWRIPKITKIKTVWSLLHEAGIVRNGSDRALRAWAKKVAKVDRLEWATSAKLDAVIESQKAWAKREGFTLKYDSSRKTFLYYPD